MSWPVVEISEIANTQYGYTASAQHRPVGPKFLRITDIVPPSIDWSTVPYCQVDERSREKYLLRAGDIVVARTGATTGYAKLIRSDEDAVFASYLVRFRVRDDRVDRDFLGLAMESESYKNFIKGAMGGAAQPNANAKTLARFPLRLPPRDAQLKIVSIVSTYENLIENNRRRIALLEDAARLLYREWFVHLRFPGHEHVKMTDGLPQGWERLSATEAFEVNPKTSRDDDGLIRYVPMAALSETGMLIDRGPLESREKSTSVRFRNGDTLLARITPCLENGKTGYVQLLEGDEVACGSTEFIVLRGRRVSNYFVYLTARQHDFRENAIKSMIGSSGRQRVQPSCFERYIVPVPSRILARLFDEAVAGIFEQIANLDQQNHKLAQARDLLLPRLMNGEIAV